MTDYTKNSKFELIDFNIAPWHDKEHANWRKLDALIAQVAIIASDGTWDNSIIVTVGQRYYDAVANEYYEVLVAHTTSGTPTTFAQDRIAHPTYWRKISSVPNQRGAWTTATVYFTNDIVLQGTSYYWCAASHLSGTFATDLANGAWVLIFNTAGAASGISNTPAGNIAATTVQAALNELDTEKQAVSGKDVAGGYAGLDGTGKINSSQLPALAITKVDVVANQAAMLALVSEQGDIAIRSDLNKTFALSTNSPGTLADWKELLTPTDVVLSVAGLTGAISAAGLKAALAIAIADVTNLQTTIDAKVADALNDGTTTIAPSQNAVFDALALKADKINVQDFLASGTWTKPVTAGFGANSLVLLEGWGGGGSGANGASFATNIAAGGGACYNFRIRRLSEMGATETVTIGAGGVAVNSAGAGNNGGNTTFGAHLTAYGGKAGATGNSQSNGGGTYISAVYNTSGVTGGHAHFGGVGASNGVVTPDPMQQSVWGGAGGGGVNGVAGGNMGGTSQFGGNGGFSSTASGVAGVAGSVPGGGGGAGCNAFSGAGGAGKARATVIGA